MSAGEKAKGRSFRTILIANRGEIALRVMRSAHALGYRCAAVYSTADANSPHVSAADLAVCIGDPAPAASYLNIEAILDAARRTGADAVHPGYGFLAENAAFAAACCDAGLVFIGPPAETIDLMGNKSKAKQRLAQAGVPCIPGYHGDDQADDRLRDEAKRIGFPLFIKASAGGGGRGMRTASSPDQFSDLLQRARSEAKGAFSDDRMLLEKAIVSPRHIEIQVAADRHGNVIHLGERECSIQRRHQKIIEETPSPAVSPALRARMGEIAVTAAKAIDYEGVGTLEFLLDSDGAFWFMEMNTRLQVEHPVTETITGIDIVELQLRIAAGEPLPYGQQDVRFDGHAMEARLCAEEPAANFAPRSGRMVLWRAPPRVRVEHAMRSGIEISPNYDSLIAKIIAHGRTREDARRALLRGLEDTVALGVTTNQSFLAEILKHPAFISGAATTAFVSDQGGTLIPPVRHDACSALAIAARLFLETESRCPSAAPKVLQHRPHHLRFEWNGAVSEAIITPVGPRSVLIEIGDDRHSLELLAINGGDVRLICNGITESAVFVRSGQDLWLSYRGRSFRVSNLARKATSRQALIDPSEGALVAAMEGRVVAVQAIVGDRVAGGQAIVTIEAMKMEHTYAAPSAGVVAALHVAQGNAVMTGQRLAEIAMVSTKEEPQIDQPGSR